MGHIYRYMLVKQVVIIFIIYMYTYTSENTPGADLAASAKRL
jgi:hypothetical protein